MRQGTRSSGAEGNRRGRERGRPWPAVEEEEVVVVETIAITQATATVDDDCRGVARSGHNNTPIRHQLQNENSRGNQQRKIVFTS